MCVILDKIKNMLREFQMIHLHGVSILMEDKRAVLRHGGGGGLKFFSWFMINLM